MDKLAEIHKFPRHILKLALCCSSINSPSALSRMIFLAKRLENDFLGTRCALYSQQGVHLLEKGTEADVQRSLSRASAARPPSECEFIISIKVRLSHTR